MWSGLGWAGLGTLMLGGQCLALPCLPLVNEIAFEWVPVLFHVWHILLGSGLRAVGWVAEGRAGEGGEGSLEGIVKFGAPEPSRCERQVYDKQPARSFPRTSAGP